MPFIDLKTQYAALKPKIDAGIFKILDHGQFIMGPEVKECEESLKKFVGSKHALTCSNGSDALQIALMALDIGAGDEVITTAFSFIATAEMILILGIKPVFVDIDPHTYNIDWRKIEAAITPKTKAIMPVSLFGQPADFDEINAIAKKNKLYVIEDAAQSFGSLYKGKRSCNLSDIGCTSFFPAKPLGCYGDGGAVFTNDDRLAELMTSIRVHGMGEHRYHHPRLGINGRLDSIQCSVLTTKLERYPWELDQRDRIAQNYTTAFKELATFGVKTPIVREHNKSAWAQYTLSVPDRTKFQSHLQAKGVPTAVHYPITMADQPAYRETSTVHDISNARQAADHVVSLPMYPDMTEEIQNQIIMAVKSVYL
ncbi:MAG: DegT/DnrJ/EryC1/StrS aminotransferase family protein [Bdellovibrionales bacterium]|nr:DegT/DnrJ/EryC1/StrS aminotransferase family protein [Bdellovibrionales bacterium]